MDDKGFGIIAAILAAAVGLVLLVVAMAGAFYLSDMPVGATVTDKSCAIGIGARSTLEVTTKFPVPGVTHVITDFDNQQCHGLRAGDNGNYAEHHLRSGRTILFESQGGACIWDSDKGFIC